MLKNFLREEDGQDLVEYSLLMAFIAVAGISVMTTARTNIRAIWSTINGRLATANTTAGQ